MFILVGVAIAILLIFVLAQKFVGVDRGVDKIKENIERELYVTPVVDDEINEEMKTLQQMMIPVQYIDSGLLSNIESKFHEIEKALKSETYSGPSPYSTSHLTSMNESFQHAKFDGNLANGVDTDVVVPKADFSNSGVVEPFNSFVGMVVSENQSINTVD